jgi:hypothetical protein
VDPVDVLAVYFGGLTGRYEIRLAGFEDRAAARRASHALAAALPEQRREIEVRRIRQDITSPSGPWRADVLEIDPRRYDVVAAHALDGTFGAETTRSLARRHGAAAAVNGGFFVTRGPLRGDSTGTLQVKERLLSEPDRGRAAAGFEREMRDGAAITNALFGRPELVAEARVVGGRTLRIDGINRARKPGEVIAFTPEFGRSTLSDSGGVEWFVRHGIVETVHRDGNAAIPADGQVLSFAAEAAAPPLSAGAEVEIDVRLAAPWSNVDSALSAGPLLLAGGRRVEEPEKESIRRIFWIARHPRTAAARRADGTILLVTVDGRQPEWSVGMTLTELTDLLLELGAVDAVNLDGGGSTTMVIGDQVVNRTSDPDGERENGDGLLVFPRP